MSSRVRTVFFADICDSTRLYEMYGDAAARRVVRDLLTRGAECIVRHGGSVIKTVGDEIMGAFPEVDGALHAAAELLRDLEDDNGLSSPGFRIGFHHGPVLFEADDLYGSTVNTAARMVDLARCRQIITTADSLAPGGSRQPPPRLRSLGEHFLPGIPQPLEVVEILWQGSSNTTSLSTQPSLAERAAHTVLRLQRGDLTLEMNAGAPALRLGRDASADLVINAHWVSRVHAVVEFRRGFFLLRDVSTNGTFVTLENGDVVPLHRNELMLRGQGTIHLGREPGRDAGEPLHYCCS